MTAKEISHRLREKMQSEVERMQFLLGLNGFLKMDFSLPSESPERAGTKGIKWEKIDFARYLQQGPASRFYLPAAQADRENLRRLVTARSPRWIERAVQEAERLCEHRIEILGHGSLDLGPKIDWHRDPITGRSWERRFWADYDPVHDCGAGDAKTILELNRHQHLPRLAKACFLTGEERYAREAVSQMLSWIEQNPAPMGIHWQSSLDIAIRAISWLWTLFFLLPSEALNDAAARRICRSLFEQLDHVYRYLSIYSSPNTHLIGEAAALFMAGILFPELKRARAWRRVGASLLVNEMERQVLSDGVYGELSSYYHCYALDFYLQAIVLAQRNRSPFPTHAWTKLSRMTEFLLHLTRPDGTIPLLGDDDGGRALALHTRNYRNFRDGLCAAAVIFRREDFKYQAEEFAEETLWLLGADSWRIYDSLTSQAPADVRSFHPTAGYFIQRSDWGKDGSHLIFDCGGLGMLSGGHGHADALSLVLFSRGKELLTDPGTFVYNCAPEWRNFFRSTKAHNTVVVDGKDQAKSAGTFKWESQSLSRVVQEFCLPGIEYAAGENVDYLRLPGGIVHGRRLLHIKPDYWAVLDDFRGEGEHRFDFYYHFAPDAEVELRSGDGRQRCLEVDAHAGESGLLLFLTASDPLQPEIAHGKTVPVQGWVSALYGEKKPASVLQAALTARAPAGAISLLTPLPHVSGRVVSRPRAAAAEAGGAVACLLEHKGFRDYLALSTSDGSTEFLGFQMEGEVFWLRTKDGALTQLLAINARRFSGAHGALFENNEPLPYVWASFGDEGIVIKSSDAEVSRKNSLAFCYGSDAQLNHAEQTE